MLLQMARPVKRTGSNNHQFNQRIPKDVLERARGRTLSIPCGGKTVSITIRPTAESVRFSLGTSDAREAKILNAEVGAHLERIWQALREASSPVSLTRRQATALSGALYRAWANEERQATLAVEWDREQKRMAPAAIEPDEEQAYFGTAAAKITEAAENSDTERLEASLGAIIDRVLLSRGIAEVDAESRALLRHVFAHALADAFKNQERNAGGDYSPDPKSERFPEWQDPKTPEKPRPQLAPKVSLKGLVEDWWREAKAAGRKPSTYDSYRHTVEAFGEFLGHDDASRVTPQDVVRFKDHRLGVVSAKTVKDNDLAGLKSVFGWAKDNFKLASNPAADVKAQAGKRQKLRNKGLTDDEGRAVLAATLTLEKGRDLPQTFAAKRWVPWLCCYTGARVGEVAQLRKEDVRKEGDWWVITITPEAGTVKTDEARRVVLHPDLVAQGFVAFVKAAKNGHLFLRPAADGDVRGPLGGVKNRLREFAREHVTDKNVAPFHGWRHRFKTKGREAGIDPRVLDAIQGHAARTAGDDYGDVTVKAMAAAMAKFPTIEIGEG